jgi:asparagine synthase (glutamine-hydrolysing)
MCGIAGIWSSNPIAEPERLAQRMDDALAHRGPDGHAWTLHDEGRLLFVHRRLAIVDPTPAGSQPMSSPDGRHTIIFNGEIYNHHALRAALERRGERFVTHSDTEVLLRLLICSGPSALAEARGMFALALWDAQERTLTVARDRFGIKPCYVAGDGARIAVASEIGALRAAGFGRRVRRSAVLAFMRWGAVPSPMTWVEDVDAVAPGTWRQWSTRGRTCGHFADARDLWSGTEDVAAAELRERVSAAFTDSVKAHLVADVPVGVFLSGGIDSTALVAAASKQVGRLNTFTVTFDEASHDEAAHAASVAARFGTTHHALRVEAKAVVDHAVHYLRRIDQPTIDGVNTYFVASAVAATGIKAVLSGIGGDEAFGGYPSFRRIMRGAHFRHVPRPLRVTAGRLASCAEPSWRREKLQHAAGAESPFELYRAVRGWMMPSEIAHLAGSALLDATTTSEVDEVERTVSVPPSTEQVASTVARYESTMYLRHQLLRDADVMSMAHGLEVRVPFVDHELISAVWPALSSHPSLLTGKRLLIDAVEPRLPDSITRRRKQGFTLPFEHWLDGPLMEFVDEGLGHAAHGGWIAADAPDAIRRAWHARACHWSRPWGLAVLGHFLKDASH